MLTLLTSQWQRDIERAHGRESGVLCETLDSKYTGRSSPWDVATPTTSRSWKSFARTDASPFVSHTLHWRCIREEQRARSAWMHLSLSGLPLIEPVWGQSFLPLVTVAQRLLVGIQCDRLRLCYFSVIQPPSLRACPEHNLCTLGNSACAKHRKDDILIAS